MPDQDHWKSLGEDIGAEVSAESYEATNPSGRDVNPAPPDKTTQPARPKRKQATRSLKSHWNALAGKLGLELTEIAEEVDKSPRDGIRGTESLATANPDSAATESSLPVAPSTDVPSSSGAPPDDSGITGPEIIGFGQPDPSRNQEIEEEEDNDPLVLRHEPFVEEVATAIDIGSLPATDESTDSSDEPRRRRRRRGGRGRRRREDDPSDSAARDSQEEAEKTKTSTFGAGVGAATDGAGVGAATDGAGAGAATEGAESGEGGEAPRRPRRRRRRRAPASSEQAQSEQAQSEQAQSEQVGSEQVGSEQVGSEQVGSEQVGSEQGRSEQGRSEQARSDQGSSEQAQSEEDLDDLSDLSIEDDDEESSESEMDGRPRSRHKKIPSWNDAIAVIVATNLGAREKNPSGRGRRRS